MSKNELLTKLIKKAKKGDKAALNTLYNQFHGKIYKYIFYLSKGKRSLAEDLTQETFITAFKNLDQLGSAYAFSSWINTIAFRTFTAHVRPMKNKLNNDYVELEDNYQSNDRDVVLKSTLQRVLETLEDNERNAILQIDLLGASYESAAKELQMSLKEFKNKIRSGRKKVIKYFEDHQIEITGFIAFPNKVSNE